MKFYKSSEKIFVVILSENNGTCLICETTLLVLCGIWTWIRIYRNTFAGLNDSVTDVLSKEIKTMKEKLSTSQPAHANDYADTYLPLINISFILITIHTFDTFTTTDVFFI